MERLPAVILVIIEVGGRLVGHAYHAECIGAVGAQSGARLPFQKKYLLALSSSRQSNSHGFGPSDLVVDTRLRDTGEFHRWRRGPKPRLPAGSASRLLQDPLPISWFLKETDDTGLYLDCCRDLTPRPWPAIMPLSPSTRIGLVRTWLVKQPRLRVRPAADIRLRGPLADVESPAADLVRFSLSAYVARRRKHQPGAARSDATRSRPANKRCR